LRGRKSAERPKILRTTEVLCCLFGSGLSGLGFNHDVHQFLISPPYLNET